MYATGGMQIDEALSKHVIQVSTHWFEVSVDEATLVDISEGREDLSEEGSCLSLSQALLGYYVVEELSTRTVLEEGRGEGEGEWKGGRRERGGKRETETGGGGEGNGKSKYVQYISCTCTCTVYIHGWILHTELVSTCLSG